MARQKKSKAKGQPSKGSSRSRRQYDRMRADRYYAEVLRETHSDIDEARADGNWTAVAALRRRAQDTRDQLDTAQAAMTTVETHSADPYSEVSDADIMDLLFAAIAQLDEGTLVRLQTAIDLKRGTAPALTVVTEPTAPPGGVES